MASRRNSAVKFYVNGRAAKDLHGITDSVGGVLSAYDTATQRAVVGLRRRAVPAAVRAVRANYNVKAATVRSRVKLEEGSRGRRGERSDYISIWASTRRLPLLEFGGRWGGRRTKGATAQIVKGERKVYAGAFISSVQGLRAIRERQFDSATGKRAPRGPLRMLRGPSVFAMLSGLDYEPARRSHEATLEELTDFYRSELRRQWAMARGRRG